MKSPTLRRGFAIVCSWLLFLLQHTSKSANKVVIFFLFIALVLRFINLNQSLWLDEAINIFYAKTNDFWWFVTQYPIGDFHPPGYFAIIWIWGRIFGFSEFAIRMPSVLFGILTIYLTFLIGKKLFNKRVGLFAALFLAISPLHIYYSQEARMYSFAAFAVVFSIYSLIMLINQQRNHLVLFILAIVLIMYSDYVAYFIIPVLFFWIFFYQRKVIRQFLSAFLGGVIISLPGLLFLPFQLINGLETANKVSGWREVVGGIGLKDILLLPVKILIGRIGTENKTLYIGVVGGVGVLACTILIHSIRKMDEKVKFLLLWLLIPPSLGILISFFIPVFSYFRFLFILPALYLLLAIGVENSRSGYLKKVVILFIFCEVVFSSIYLFNPRFHREDWKGGVMFINNNVTPQTLVLHKNNEVPAPFRYYQKEGLNVEASFKKIPVSKEEDFKDIDFSSIKNVYLFDYLVDITDPKRLSEKKLENMGYKKTQTIDYRGIGFIYLYEKDK